MLCQNCNKKPATIHLTEIINEEEKREVHLCEECAKEKGLHYKTHFSIQDLLGNLINMPQGAESAQETPKPCPECGISYDDFRTRGRFGCKNDYRVFAGQLEPLFDKIHHARRHTGKVPRRASENLARDEVLLDLKERLSEAINNEDYEKAAELRDQIGRMEGNR